MNNNTLLLGGKSLAIVHGLIIKRVAPILRNLFKLHLYIRIAIQKNFQTLAIGKLRCSYGHVRSLFLFLLIFVISACSAQNDSTTQTAQLHPILAWILIGLLIIVWIAVGIYVLAQIYYGLVKRDLNYTLGGVLGFFGGLILGLVIDNLIGQKDGSIAGLLMILGMYLGDHFLKVKLEFRGSFAFLIGILWIGVFSLYIFFSVSMIQQEITVS